MRARADAGARAAKLTNATRSPHDKRVRHLGCGADPDALCLEILADRLLPILATKAAALVSAERRHVAHRPIGVHPDGAGSQSVSHSVGATDALRPDSGGETEIDVIGDADRVVLVLEGNDR